MFSTRKYPQAEEVGGVVGVEIPSASIPITDHQHRAMEPESISLIVAICADGNLAIPVRLYSEDVVACDPCCIMQLDDSQSHELGIRVIWSLTTRFTRHKSDARDMVSN